MFSDSAFRKLHYKRYRLLPCLEKRASIILALPPEPVIEAEDIIEKIFKNLGLWELTPRPPHRSAKSHPLSAEPHTDYSDSQAPLPIAGFITLPQFETADMSLRSSNVWIEGDSLSS